MKIKILKPVAGIYKMSANIGDVISVNENQASEMIKSGHAEEVKRVKRTKK